VAQRGEEGKTGKKPVAALKIASAGVGDKRRSSHQQIEDAALPIAIAGLRGPGSS
jgi:hypothetical protein